MISIRRGLATATLICLACMGAGRAAATATAATRALDARQLETLDRLGDPRVSPDGRWVVYDVRTVDYAANLARHAAWLQDLDAPDAPPRRLESVPEGASAVRWAPDGKGLYFLGEAGGLTQVWMVALGGGAPTRLTDLPLDVESFRISPDQSRLIVSLSVFPDAEDPAATRAREDARAGRKASGALYDSLLERHWDRWSDGTRSHLFALARGVDGRFTGPPVPLMKGMAADTPAPPYGDESDYAITADSRSVIFSAKVAGDAEAWSTNLDLWMAPLDGSAAPRNMTPDNLAADMQPVVSPDGTRLAWEATRRPGFESDHQAVWIMDLKTGARREADPGLDLTADLISWSPDSREVLLTAAQVQQNRLFALDATTGAIRPLTGDGYVSAFDRGGANLVYAQSTLETPDALWLIHGQEPPRRITHLNDAALSGVALSHPESFSFSGWNGDTVHGYVFRPVGYAPGKTYPSVLILHGGPESSFFNLWTYRWNPQVWAGWGYGVVVIDYHGSTGYGQAFTDAIAGHWGDRPLEDVRKGWTAALAKYAFLDGKRACAAGASYGGYLVNWMASQWPAPWKCMISHDGVFDTASLGASTEELWFTEWEFGGSLFDNPAAYERFNPARFAGQWNTPTLFIHSAKDFRVPLEQGLAGFTTLRRRGVPSQFLTFPDENHWVLKPQNSVQWHDTVRAWLDRWTS